jgi:hypothetical protein
MKRTREVLARRLRFKTVCQRPDNALANSPVQYSSGNKMVVTLRSASVISRIKLPAAFTFGTGELS